MVNAARQYHSLPTTSAWAEVTSVALVLPLTSVRRPAIGGGPWSGWRRSRAGAIRSSTSGARMRRRRRTCAADPTTPILGRTPAASGTRPRRSAPAPRASPLTAVRRSPPPWPRPSSPRPRSRRAKCRARLHVDSPRGVGCPVLLRALWNTVPRPCFTRRTCRRTRSPCGSCRVLSHRLLRGHPVGLRRRPRRVLEKGMSLRRPRRQRPAQEKPCRSRHICISLVSSLFSILGRGPLCLVEI